MRPLLYILLVLFFTACKKEKHCYHSTNNAIHQFEHTQIGYRTGKNFDLDGNGTMDIGFLVLMHIGDPLSQMDKISILRGIHD